MCLHLAVPLIAFIYTFDVTVNCTSSCILKTKTMSSYYKQGDIMIGGIVQIHTTTMPSYEVIDFGDCIFPTFQHFWHTKALIYAIEEINRNEEFLPNITLGYRIYDSCNSRIRAILATLSLLSKQTDMVPNFCCQREDVLIGFIGDYSSATSYSIAQLLGIYKHPQISYGAVDPLFTDKLRFPSFYRTVPNELSQYAAITQVIKYFSWDWVGILASEDDRGEKALQELKKKISLIGGCVEFAYIVPTEMSYSSYPKMLKIFTHIKRCSSQVIIVYNSMNTLAQWFTIPDVEVPFKIWIASLAMPFSTDYRYEKSLKILNGTLALSIENGQLKGFKDVLYSIKPSMFPHDKNLAKMWQENFNCKLRDIVDVDFEYTRDLHYCSGNESLLSPEASTNDVMNIRFSYNVYTATYALVHALEEMILSYSEPDLQMSVRSLQKSLLPWKLNKYLQRTRFKTPAGDEIVFDDTGEMSAGYDIINWIYTADGKSKNIEVGTFDPSAEPGHQLSIDQSSIQWPPGITMHDTIPRSACSESCLPGSRKAPIEGQLLCCFDCVSCAEGEYSNIINMENCLQCAEDQWPNEKKDGCINKLSIFLSFTDILGASMTCIAVIFSLATAGVLIIFHKHRDTPLVKANNRNLSYALLISLMLSFLCSLLFIGAPTSWTCLIQQAAFGIIFTAAVACVLAKTITVVIAFNATKPGSRLRKFLGFRISGSMVCFCTLGEVVICLSWLCTAPPHPYTDMNSETGKMILQCAQGSTTAFYTVIGYIGLLAFASFVVAFLARNLPDRFNEAQLITFSMLVFCSVWVSFIPAYLSTKGRYLVAVEIFAILASSAGLLCCIFIPKCYIIIFRPDINTK